MRTVALLLAAGSSRRFQTAGAAPAGGDPDPAAADKLLALHQGRPLYEHALEALASCPLIEETIVVVRPGFPAITPRPRVRVVVNPDHAEGMASSLRAGVRAAPGEAEAYLLALADMPGVRSGLIAALIRFAETTPRSIVAPVCRGRRGHPVLFRASLRERLLSLTGDVGARELLRENPEEIAPFTTDDPCVLRDIDRPEDLEGSPAEEPGPSGPGERP
jgi:molybdenum cofactor cytidylyltransferase